MRAFFSGFDIFHFHFISPDNLYDLNFIPAGKKIILSFWGSDLYSLNGTTDYSIQYKAVERADIVTLHSNEMRSVFLEKFGSDKLNKTRLTLFGINEDRLDLLSGFKKNAVSDNFRKKYKIQQQIVIMLGYSAAEGQQHLPVLEVLGRMPEEIKQHIVLFIPLSYNSENRGYVKNVLSCIRQVPLTCIPVTDYLSDAEMLELISNTQIMLNVRETDAMNNAMVECLYNGTLVINGSWLPYSRLKQQQVYFAEVDHVEELRTVLPRLINTISTELEKCKGNEAKIRAMMSGEVIIKDWAAIYAGI
jgi:hypothetical protein